jgi:hypothetical protein
VATPAVHRGHPLKPNFPACGNPNAELFTNNKTQVTCTECRAKTDHDPKTTTSPRTAWLMFTAFAVDRRAAHHRLRRSLPRAALRLPRL